MITMDDDHDEIDVMTTTIMMPKKKTTVTLVVAKTKGLRTTMATLTMTQKGDTDKKKRTKRQGRRTGSRSSPLPSSTCRPLLTYRAPPGEYSSMSGATKDDVGSGWPSRQCLALEAVVALKVVLAQGTFAACRRRMQTSGAPDGRRIGAVEHEAAEGFILIHHGHECFGP